MVDVQETEVNIEKTYARYEAADEVCHTLVLMMGLGGLNIEQEWRDFLAPSISKWTDLAVETGVMRSGEEDD